MATKQLHLANIRPRNHVAWARYARKARSARSSGSIACCIARKYTNPVVFPVHLSNIHIPQPNRSRPPRLPTLSHISLHIVVPWIRLLIQRLLRLRSASALEIFRFCRATSHSTRKHLVLTPSYTLGAEREKLTAQLHLSPQASKSSLRPHRQVSRGCRLGQMPRIRLSRSSRGTCRLRLCRRRIRWLEVY